MGKRERTYIQSLAVNDWTIIAGRFLSPKYSVNTTSNSFESGLTSHPFTLTNATIFQLSPDHQIRKATLLRTVR